MLVDATRCYYSLMLCIAPTFSPVLWDKHVPMLIDLCCIVIEMRWTFCDLCPSTSQTRSSLPSSCWQHLKLTHVSEWGSTLLVSDSCWGNIYQLDIQQLDIHQTPTAAEVQEDRCTLQNKSTLQPDFQSSVELRCPAGGHLSSARSLSLCVFYYFYLISVPALCSQSPEGSF